ncbi:MAG: hypothetical protein M9945_12285, partial [Aquamicrobium sp.]|uniref:hypothetical protein n=1 Tax=Aquamicrobium sp. TaxID=1872579 RepID=UPI00349EFAD6|nr:hypothetical protein [Aquamicrobium sp.]
LEPHHGAIAWVAVRRNRVGAHDDVGGVAVLYCERFPVEEHVKRIRDIAAAALTSWWVIGAVGWGIVILEYPIDTVLPIYAE